MMGFLFFYSAMSKWYNHLLMRHSAAERESKKGFFPHTRSLPKFLKLTGCDKFRPHDGLMCLKNWFVSARTSDNHRQTKPPMIF
jgi:hypothetical protein